MNIGFIGLGNMGAGMAHNLLMHCKDSDDTLIVLDINKSALTDFIAERCYKWRKCIKDVSTVRRTFYIPAKLKRSQSLGIWQ